MDIFHILRKHFNATSATGQCFRVDTHFVIPKNFSAKLATTEGNLMPVRYIYCYRDVDNKCPLVSAYVFAMGGYQMVFGVSWGHHFLFRPYDLDVSSMISGLLGIV